MFNTDEMAKCCQIIDSQTKGKYDGACIYSISIGDQLVYIGKSTDTRKRIAAHMMNIEFKDAEAYNSHKYQVLREAKNRGMKVSFDVMYRSQEIDPNKIDEDIGYQEGVFIRKYLPPLNYQIPKEENWHKFNTNKKATTITVDEILALSRQSH